MNPPVDAPTSRQRSPVTSIANVRSAVSSFSPPRDTYLGGADHLDQLLVADRRSRLVDDRAVDRHPPRHHQRLGPAAGLGQPQLRDPDVEAPAGHQAVRVATISVRPASSAVSPGIAASSSSARACDSSASARARSMPSVFT